MVEQNNPGKVEPDKGLDVKPKGDVEINPAKPGTNTEVDLDKDKTKTYPGTKPPERH